MKSNKIEEIVLRIIDEDIDDFLKKRGFFPLGNGIFEDFDGRRRIDIKNGELKCYSIEGSSVYSEPLIVMQLGFIPETPILDYLLRKMSFV